MTEYEIKPKDKFSFGIGELLQFRELIYFFVWREIKIKYKQTFLGILWVILQPAIFMLIATFVIGKKIGTGSSAIPTPVFFLSGFLGWNIFSSALNSAGNSMVSNAGIIKKIYFPRLIIPFSAVASAFFDFIFGLIFYIGVVIYLKAEINPYGLIMFPISLLLIFFAAFGTGTLISALNVKYRDFRYLLPFLIQVLMFLSPVFYDVYSGNKTLNYLFACSPMYAPLELIRAHLEGSQIHINLIFLSTTVNLLLTFIGISVFRKTESYFADLA